MAEYQAKSVNSLTFDLTKDDRLVGQLSYKSWFRFDALMVLTNNETYQVEPKGFWGTTIELKSNERVLLQFSMNWSGDIVIETYTGDTEKGYVLKHKGFFKESFILAGPDGTELLVMKPDMKWTKMSYEYQIATSDDFESFPDKDMLLLISLHCANYYVSMMMGGMGM